MSRAVDELTKRDKNTQINIKGIVQGMEQLKRKLDVTDDDAGKQSTLVHELSALINQLQWQSKRHDESLADHTSALNDVDTRIDAVYELHDRKNYMMSHFFAGLSCI